MLVGLFSFTAAVGRCYQMQMAAQQCSRPRHSHPSHAHLPTSKAKYAVSVHDQFVSANQRFNLVTDCHINDPVMLLTASKIVKIITRGSVFDTTLRMTMASSRPGSAGSRPTIQMN